MSLFKMISGCNTYYYYDSKRIKLHLTTRSDNSLMAVQVSSVTATVLTCLRPLSMCHAVPLSTRSYSCYPYIVSPNSNLHCNWLISFRQSEW